MIWALSLAAFLIVLNTWVAYMARVPSGRVPARPWGSVALQISGIALGLAALAVWMSQATSLSTSIAVWAMNPMAIVFGAFFLWLLTQRKTPVGDLRVEVGDTLLPFAATTSEGTLFHTREFEGQRVLLKFFRGGW